MTLLDVSHKLDLHDVRLEAFEALRLLFPCGPDYRLSIKPAIQGIKTKRARQLFLRVFPPQAINLFRKYNISSLMLMAYYHAAQLSVKDIVSGVVGADGVKVTTCAYDITKVLERRDHLKWSRRFIVYGWLNTLTSDGKPRLIGEDCENGPAFETGETCFCYILRMLMELKSSEYLDTRTDTLPSV